MLPEQTRIGMVYPSSTHTRQTTQNQEQQQEEQDDFFTVNEHLQSPP